MISLPETDFTANERLILNAYPQANIKCVQGGKERQNSVYNALLACSPNCDIVLIHDGVRPFFGKELIQELIAKVEPNIGVIPVSKIKLTVKECISEQVVRSVPRDNLYNVHTPQCFVYQDILRLNNEALRDNKLYTDDASLYEEQGLAVRTVLESDFNIKITTQEDLLFAEFLLLQ